MDQGGQDLHLLSSSPHHPHHRIRSDHRHRSRPVSFLEKPGGLSRRSAAQGHHLRRYSSDSPLGLLGELLIRPDHKVHD